MKNINVIANSSTLPYIYVDPCKCDAFIFTKRVVMERFIELFEITTDSKLEIIIIDCLWACLRNKKKLIELAEESCVYFYEDHCDYNLSYIAWTLYRSGKSLTLIDVYRIDLSRKFKVKRPSIKASLSTLVRRIGWQQRYFFCKVYPRVSNREIPLIPAYVWSRVVSKGFWDSKRCGLFGTSNKKPLPAGFDIVYMDSLLSRNISCCEDVMSLLKKYSNRMIVKKHPNESLSECAEALVCSGAYLLPSKWMPMELYDLTGISIVMLPHLSSHMYDLARSTRIVSLRKVFLAAYDGQHISLDGNIIEPASVAELEGVLS